MELKSPLDGSDFLFDMFKSHLYGIEISNISIFVIIFAVFKSHLYGIEINRRNETSC